MTQPQLYSRAEADISAEEDEEAKVILANLKKKPENKVCMDCNNKNPSWVTLTFGAFLCMECSAKHRSWGTHVSFVRSAGLDKWGMNQARRMELGGNGLLRQFFRDHGLADLKEQRYATAPARQYKLELDAKQMAAQGKKPDAVLTISGTTSPNADSPRNGNGNGTPVVLSPVPEFSRQHPDLASPSTPASEGAASPSPVVTSVVSVGAKAKAPSTKKKGGLGGAKQAVGSTKAATPAVAEKVEETNKQQSSGSSSAAPSATPVKSFSGGAYSLGAPSASSASVGEPVTSKGRYYGISSDTMDAPPGAGPVGGGDSFGSDMGSGMGSGSTAPVNIVRAKPGKPDYSGFGSGGVTSSTMSDSGPGYGDSIYAARKGLESAQKSASKVISKFGESVKSFLDDL